MLNFPHLLILFPTFLNTYLFRDDFKRILSLKFEPTRQPFCESPTFFSQASPFPSPPHEHPCYISVCRRKQEHLIATPWHQVFSTQVQITLRQKCGQRVDTVNPLQSTQCGVSFEESAGNSKVRRISLSRKGSAEAALRGYACSRWSAVVRVHSMEIPQKLCLYMNDVTATQCAILDKFHQEFHVHAPSHVPAIQRQTRHCCCYSCAIGQSICSFCSQNVVTFDWKNFLRIP